MPTSASRQASRLGNFREDVRGKGNAERSVFVADESPVCGGKENLEQERRVLEDM
jgi:hypothetical protein